MQQESKEDLTFADTVEDVDEPVEDDIDTNITHPHFKSKSLQITISNA